MDYSFTTTWYVEAPIEAVWAAIRDAETWPSWWRYVRRVETLEEGDERGVGAVHRQEWSSALPYRLRFTTRTTKVERPHVLEADAGGELAGRGRWELRETGSVTAVRYDWVVRTTRRWMDVLAPIAGPAFGWNHRVVMEEGGRALARHLGARLARPSTHQRA